MLGVALLNNSYRFQGYSSIIQHLCIILCVHYPKSSLLPSPFIPLYLLPILFFIDYLAKRKAVSESSAWSSCYISSYPAGQRPALELTPTTSYVNPIIHAVTREWPRGGPTDPWTTRCRLLSGCMHLWLLCDPTLAGGMVVACS